MARVVLYLLDQELQALQQLAEQEYRPMKAQAALIIRNELKRLGLVQSQSAAIEEVPVPSGELQGGGAA